MSNRAYRRRQEREARKQRDRGHERHHVHGHKEGCPAVAVEAINFAIDQLGFGVVAEVLAKEARIVAEAHAGHGCDMAGLAEFAGDLERAVDRYDAILAAAEAGETPRPSAEVVQ